MNDELEFKPEFFKDPLGWMVHHSVSANLMMVILLVMGFFLMLGIKKEVFPDFERDQIKIDVSYPGSSAENMEQAIAIPIENAISNVDDIGDITDTIGNGSVSINVEVLNSSNMAAIFRQIQSQVSSIGTFPDDMPPPSVSIARSQQQLEFLMIYGNVDGNSLKQAMQVTREAFAQDVETGALVIYGDQDYQIKVETPQNNLRRYGLTLQQVGQAIQASGADISGGTIKNSKLKVDLRFNDQKNYAKDVKNIVILKSPTGTPLYLKDIATVTDTLDDSIDYDVTNNNKPAIFFMIEAKEGQTPQSVSKAVHAKVAEVQKLLPKGVNIALLYDMSKTFDQRADILIREGLMGIVLVVLVLSLFLEWRLAFWTSWGIPISLLGSFLLLYITMPITGFSINILSLFAFILVLGIVVDDAIVVGENVYSHKERMSKGQSSKLATANGVKEVASSVFFSIFTNVVSFLPLAFLPGTMGKMFRQIPVVVIFVLLISLFESLFILPARISFSNKEHKPTRFNPFVWFKIKFNRIFDIVVKYYYVKLLKVIATYRYFVFALILAGSIIFFGFLLSGRMGFTLMPGAEADFVTLTVDFPYSSTLETKMALRKNVVDKAMAIGNQYGGSKEYKSVEADIQDAELNVRIFLADGNIPLSASDFLKKWQTANGTFIGVVSYQYSATMASPGGNANITLRIAANDPLTLDKATDYIVHKLEKYPYVTYVSTNQTGGDKEYNFKLNQYGYALGLTPASVANQVRNAVYGYRAIQQVKDHNTLDIMVKYPKDEISSPNDIDKMIVTTPNGTQVPLMDVATISQDVSTPVIRRTNFERKVEIYAYVDPDSKSPEILNKFLATDFKAAESKFPGLHYAPGGRQKEQAQVGSALFIGFILTLITIYTALAMFFNSYIQPVIIMIAIPFGFIGAILGHLIMGFPLSVPSIFGLLALSGVVVNASMIIIYFSNVKRENDKCTAKSAIISVSKRRFRPILLTALTAFFGMLPTIVSSSPQVAFLRPIAVALGFGVIFSTVISLICMPVFYLIVDDVRNFFRKKPKEIA